MGLEVIDGERVRAAVSLRAARRAVRAALIAVADGTAIAPDEMAMHFAHGGELHVKGAHLRGSRWIAFKVASGGFPDGGNSGGTMVLDATSGSPRAFLADGGWLTEVRTAAAAAVASTTLAPATVRRVAILGTGIQARYQLAAHREALPDAEFVVWGRTGSSAERLGAEAAVAVAPSLEAAIAGADVVVTITSAKDPFVLDAMAHDGLQITAVGADTPAKNEVDPDILNRAQLVAADDVEVTARVGELHHAPDARDRAIALGEVLAGRHAGRAADSDLTVCDLCGLGVEDAAMADLVMQRLGLEETGGSRQ